MNTVHRLATLNDTNRLFDLRRQSIIKLAAKGMSIEEAARWAEELTVAGMERKICELEIWVAEVSEKVVSWGAIRGDQLEGLYTDPQFASQGIGTELLRMLEELMQKSGISAVRAEASSNAEAFYLRRGYERTAPPTSKGAQPIRKRLSKKLGASCGSVMRFMAIWRMSNLQSLIFIAAMVVAVIAVRSISILPSGSASR